MELYVHIPFCVRKCRYCDFPSFSNCQGLVSPYISALLAEAARYEGCEPIDTVYIGGGTPSILPADELESLLVGLKSVLPIANNAEFSSEANPGTLTDQWLEAAVSSGVNRLSFGVQAAQDHLLKTLGRIHTRNEVETSVCLARKHGISNCNLDLMFGLPGQTEDDWCESLQFALSLEPKHLSCYGLIPEEGTPLKSDLDSGRLTLLDEDTERRMYDAAIIASKAAGMHQYEISNFAQPGYECRHNIGYWQQAPYIGLGSSAASMVTDIKKNCAYIRRQNPTGIQAYIQMIESGSFAEQQLINRNEAMFETVMLGLRMNSGVSFARFQSMHGQDIRDICGQKLIHFQEQGLLSITDNSFTLTRRGMDVQNTVLVELMDEFE